MLADRSQHDKLRRPDHDTAGHGGSGRRRRGSAGRLPRLRPQARWRRAVLGTVGPIRDRPNMFGEPPAPLVGLPAAKKLLLGNVNVGEDCLLSTGGQVYCWGRLRPQATTAEAAARCSSFEPLGRLVPEHKLRRLADPPIRRTR